VKKRNEVYRCRLSECNRELPYRYKGRQRIFCNADCRKKYHDLNG